jgi:hypothetical protein
MKKIILPALLLFISFQACKIQKTPKEEVIVTCNTTSYSYSKDIQPIIGRYCTSCHGEDGDGGYNFILMKDVVRAANNGELMATIRWDKGFPKMPENGDKLDKATIAKIDCWINNGMKP